MGMSFIDRHRDCVEDEMKRKKVSAHTTKTNSKRADGNSLWATFACSNLIIIHRRTNSATASRSKERNNDSGQNDDDDDDDKRMNELR